MECFISGVREGSAAMVCFISGVRELSSKVLGFISGVRERSAAMLGFILGVCRGRWTQAPAATYPAPPCHASTNVPPSTP